jgi:hypothetical protein
MKWVESIFSSPGRKNPALDAYASTYSIGNPRDTFSVNPFMIMTVDAMKPPLEVVIKYDLTV